MKYAKKPVVIEAFQWFGDERQTEDPEWIKEAIKKEDVYFFGIGTPDVELHIKTLEGVMAAKRGDFIIKGIKGELYPCKPDIFEATYETVDDTFESRLKKETEELALKVNKLNRFMETPKFYELEDEDKALLYDQSILMTRYLQVLGKRSKRLKIILKPESWKV